MSITVQQTEEAYVPYKTTKSGGAVSSGLEDLNAIFLFRRDSGRPFIQHDVGSGTTLYVFDDTSNSVFLLRNEQTDAPVGFLTTWTRTKQVASTFIKQNYQGMGLGKALYAAAIRHHGELYSDNALSEFSSRLWQSLSKTFTVKLFMREKEMTILDWSVGRSRIVYPVIAGADVGLHQERVSLEELMGKPPQPKVKMEDTDTLRNQLYDDFFAKTKLKSAAEAARLVAHQ